MDRWVGKTAVVTGGNGGIGSAICKKLASIGLRVVNLDINVPADDDNSVHSRQCDLLKLEDINAAFMWVEEKFGGVDLLINCAGIGKLGHITNIANQALTDQDIQLTMGVNIIAMIFCTRLAVDSMKKRGFDGHIINLNSVAGHYTPVTDQFNVYSTSKYGVTAFTASLANEFASLKCKIKITSVSPGLVQTSLSENSADFSRVPTLQPDEVADQVLYVVGTPPHINISEITIQPVAEKLL